MTDLTKYHIHMTRLKNTDITVIDETEMAAFWLKDNLSGNPHSTDYTSS